METLQLDYFRGAAQAEQYAFYRIPKILFTLFTLKMQTESLRKHTFVYIKKKLRNIVAPELFCAICYSLFAAAFLIYWFLRTVCLYLDIYSFAAFLAASQFSTELHPYC